MMMDPIADMLVRIKNALMVGHQEVMIPHSKMKEAIAQILVAEGYVNQLQVTADKPQKQMVLELKYVDSLPAVSGVKRVSKPGRRLYVSANRIPTTLGGYGLTILSTNQGILTNQQARQKNVGGEIICQIW